MCACAHTHIQIGIGLAVWAYYSELIRGERGQFSQGFTFMEGLKFRTKNFLERNHTYTQRSTLAPIKKTFITQFRL